MAETIEARVIQKIATASEWATSDLVPYKGEVMLVSDSSGKVLNIKIGDGVNMFPDLNYMFDSIQQNVNYIPYEATPASAMGFTLVGEGSYANGIVVDANMWAVLYWDGAVWTEIGSYDLPAVDVANDYGTSSTKAISQAKATETHNLSLDLKRKSDEVISDSINLADKSTIISGKIVGYGNGNISDDANSRIIIIPILKENTNYSIVGVNSSFIGNGYNSSANPANLTTFNSVTRVQTFGDNLAPQPKTQFQFNSSTDVKYIAINVSSSGTLNDNTVMLYEGVLSDNPPYEPFGVYLKADKIVGEIPDVVYNEDLIPINNDLQLIEDSLNAVESKVSIIEEVSGINLADKNTIIVGKAISYNNGNIVDDATGRLLLVNLPKRNTDYAIVGISANSYHLYNNTADIDNISSFNSGNRVLRGGTNGTLVNSYEFNSGEDGYILGIRISPSSSSFDNTVMLYEGDLSNIPPYEPFSPIENKINFDKIYNVPDFVENISDLYYSYNPSGGETSNGRMSVFTRMFDNYFAGFNVDHVVNSSIRANLWRIRDSYTYRLIEGSMVLQSGKQLLLANENEYVYFITGASDSTGGFHGDEQLTFVDFYANNQTISLSSSIPLTACDSFYYRQISETFDPEDTLPSPFNVATHVKITSFYNGCYDTYNNLKIHKDLSLAQSGQGIYGGLSCIHVNVGSVAFSNYSSNIVANQDSGFKLNQSGRLDKNGTVNYYNTTTKLSANCVSYWDLIIQNNIDITKSFSDSSIVTLWDRSSDFKYYHRVTTPTLFYTNDVISSRMIVKFNLS